MYQFVKEDQNIKKNADNSASIHTNHDLQLTILKRLIAKLLRAKRAQRSTMGKKMW